MTVEPPSAESCRFRRRYELFVYLRRFEAIRFAAESNDATIFLDKSRRIRDYNRAARLLFPVAPRSDRRAPRRRAPATRRRQ